MGHCLRHVVRTSQVKRREPSWRATRRTTWKSFSCTRRYLSNRRGREVIQRSVVTTNIFDSSRVVLCLPFRPESVKPGVMQEEERVPRAGDGVQHLSQKKPSQFSRSRICQGCSHLTTNAAVSSAMGTRLDTRPKVCECRHVHAPVHGARPSHQACSVINLTLDAVVVDLVARSQRVGVVRKWPIRNAGLVPGAVSAEAKDGIQYDRLGESSGVKLFFPVPDSKSKPWASMI